MEKNLSWKEFMKVEMRVGTIIEAELFDKARKPSYKMKVDFGPKIGILKTSAQITALYRCDSLIGQQIIATINFPSKQIATMMSECLVMGSVAEDGTVTLIQPERPVENGIRIG